MANELPSNNSDDTSREDLSKEDILRELADDEEEEKDDESSKEDEDEEDSSGKEDDDEESDEEEDGVKLVDGEDEDEKLEDIKLVTPFRKKDIEKDFPGIFKKYPYLEKAYFTERAYREVFDSPEDAKEAKDAIESFGEIEKSLLAGDSTQILTRVKEEDPKAFHRLVDNYLPNLLKVDPAAHNHVTGGFVKNLISLLAREGKKNDNEEFKKAALLINNFIFDTDEFEPHKPLSNSQPQEEDTIAEERKAFLQERYDTSREELQGKVDNIISSTIKSLIDPKDDLTEYVKKNAVRDAMEAAQNALDNDESLRRQLDKLWERAFNDGFKRTTLNAIRDIYLSKARTILKPIIKKTRIEALKGSGKRVRDDGDSDTEKSEPANRSYAKGSKHKENRGSATSNKGGRKSAEIPRGMSTLDYLNSD